MKSIHGYLTWRILSAVGLLLILSGLAIYFLTRAALLAEFDAGLRAKALTIVSVAERGNAGIQVELPDEFLGGTNQFGAAPFFELRQTNGTIISRSPALREVHLPMRFGPADKPIFGEVDLPDDHDGRAIGLIFTPKAEDEDEKKLPPLQAVLVLAVDVEAIDRTLNILATVIVLTLLLAVLVTVPVVSLALRRGHAPLEKLAGQAAAITANSLQTRFPVEALPKELQPITARLNDLLGRLESSFARERRFSADLAHELRTPLAELRALAEVELAWPESGEAQKHREVLSIALQMEVMVVRLLEMARCEEGKISLRLEPVSLAPLVEEVWRPLSAKAESKHLDFQFRVPADAVIQTDRALYRSILSNLLANAVEYAPAHGRGEIQWRGEAGGLIVNNTVHDLTAVDVPHLFERLWRKDSSRTGGEHCGLGLALSRSFAEMLELELTAELKNEKTLVFLLKPTAKSDFQIERLSPSP